MEVITSDKMVEMEGCGAMGLIHLLILGGGAINLRNEVPVLSQALN